MAIGYARVSIADQELILQIEALACARKGDSLLVWNMGRIGCFIKRLVHPAANLDAQQADLRTLTGDLDAQTAAGRFFVCHEGHRCYKMLRQRLWPPSTGMLQLWSAIREQYFKKR